MSEKTGTLHDVVVVRTATSADADTIALFNRKLAKETEDKELDEKIVSQGVRRLLADERRGRYRVAIVDGVVVGQLMHTFEWSDWRDGDVWWIQSVYVEPAHRGRGVFRALHASLVDEARSTLDVVGVRLYVEHANRRAQDTYRALGMVHAGYEVFEQMFARSDGGRA